MRPLQIMLLHLWASRATMTLTMCFTYWRPHWHRADLDSVFLLTWHANDANRLDKNFNTCANEAAGSAPRLTIRWHFTDRKLKKSYTKAQIKRSFVVKLLVIINCAQNILMIYRSLYWVQQVILILGSRDNINLSENLHKIFCSKKSQMFWQICHIFALISWCWKR